MIVSSIQYFFENIRNIFSYLACSFIFENKRDFQFKHNSVIENVRFNQKLFFKFQ